MFNTVVKNTGTDTRYILVPDNVPDISSKYLISGPVPDSSSITVPGNGTDIRY